MRGLKQMLLREQKYLENIVEKAKAGLRQPHILVFHQPGKQVFDLDAVVVPYSKSISGQNDFLVVVPDT